MRNTVIEEIALGPTPYSKADDLIEKAWEAPTPLKQVKFAQKALDKDLDCIDAYILLSHNCETLGEQLALLREAVRVGDRLWQPYMDVEDMAWWGFIGTRPYMRALHELGLSLEAVGDFAEARECYTKLLTLNPNDNQGVRELLVHLLLIDGQTVEASAILDRYPDDMLLGMEMSRLALALCGRDPNTVQLLEAKIRMANEHVLPLLASILNSGKTPLALDVDYLEFGSENEAAAYIENSFSFWKQPKIKKAFLARYSDSPVALSSKARTRGPEKKK